MLGFCRDVGLAMLPGPQMSAIIFAWHARGHNSSWQKSKTQHRDHNRNKPSSGSPHLFQPPIYLSLSLSVGPVVFAMSATFTTNRLL